MSAIDGSRISGGRFAVEPRDGLLRLRVRDDDMRPWWRVVALLDFVAVLACYPYVDRAIGDLWFAAGWVGLLASGFFMRGLDGARLSRYPRVRRSVELRRTEGDGGYRGPAQQTSLVIDGRAFDVRDVLGVVIAKLSGVRSLGRGEYAPFVQFTPTIVFDDLAYELDVFVDADEPYAHSMADEVASAIADRPEKASLVDPNKETTAKGFDIILRILFGCFGESVAGCIALTSWRRFFVEYGVLLFVGELLITRTFARLGARQRSRTAQRLIGHLKRATHGAR